MTFVRSAARNFLWRYRLATRTQVHFLHIGKAAGTQVREIARHITRHRDDLVVIKEEHDVMLRDIPQTHDFFFSIRDPISRFRSGFYSRKRKGRPYYVSEWSQHDRVAFERFEHANDLAEALFAPDAEGRLAFAAMKSIRHTAQNQSDWFVMQGAFLQVRPPMAILRQEHFDEDVAAFLKKLRVPEFSPSPRTVHANNYEDTPDISEAGSRNLRKWYAQDYEFLRVCEDWIQEAQTN